MVRRRRRGGVSLVELLVVVAIVSLLAALVAPAVMDARRAAAGATCRLRLRQIGVALAAYQELHAVYPGGGYNWSVRPSFFSVHSMLLPHLDESALYERLNFAVGHYNVPEAANAENATAAGTRVAQFLCPADAGLPRGGAANSYRGNMGSLTFATDEAENGAFSMYWCRRPADFADGLSHTAFFGERLVGDRQPRRYTPSRDVWLLELSIPNLQPNLLYRNACPAPPPLPTHASDVGGSWLDASLRHTQYRHVFVPNASVPDCALTQSILNVEGAVGARSLHPGTVHTLLGDGSVRAVGDSIDAAVWTALATRAGGETARLGE